MAWSFLNSGSSQKKRTQMLGVDLGGRMTKAVLLERRGKEALALMRYALVDAPIYEKKFSPELLGEHLRNVAEALGGGTRFTTLAIGLDDAMVRQVELPPMPVGEMRQLLKMNSKNILQQDLPNHVFDCHIFPPKTLPGGKSADPATPGGPAKLKVLVTGAKAQLVNDYLSAVKNAGLTAECILPGMVGPVNAFEMAMPQVFANESVALVDIGFKHSTICVLDHGELALSRVVNLGGDKLTAGMAEALNMTYAAAEGIKMGMAPKDKADGEVTAAEAQATALAAQVTPLGRELRASLDFFEHQQDRPVTQVYVSGGTAKSELFLEMLHAEMGAECKTWNPTASLQLALPGQQAVEIEQVGSQLGVAIGAAMAAL